MYLMRSCDAPTRGVKPNLWPPFAPQAREVPLAWRGKLSHPETVSRSRFDPLETAKKRLPFWLLLLMWTLSGCVEFGRRADHAPGSLQPRRGPPLCPPGLTTWGAPFGVWLTRPPPSKPAAKADQAFAGPWLRFYGRWPGGVHPPPQPTPDRAATDCAAQRALDLRQPVPLQAQT